MLWIIVNILLPADAVHVDQKTHKFCDTDGRVGVVELHSNLVCELLPFAPRLGIQESFDHVLRQT
jgi:hypothetical protein